MGNEVAEAETRLVDGWIVPALGPAAHVRVGRIDDATPSDGTTVTLTLIDIAPAPLPSGPAGLPPLQLRARYLVTVAAADSGAEREAIADLAFTAGPIPEVDLEPKTPGLEIWRSLGIAMRPALLIAVLVQRQQHRPMRRVRQPLVAKWASSRPLLGVVVGPGDVPIAGALVEVEGLPQTAYSNYRGEFAFRAVPGDDPSPTLVVSAKGATVRVRVDGGATSSSAPLLIRIPLSES
jgi:hypothetical protein